MTKEDREYFERKFKEDREYYDKKFSGIDKRFDNIETRLDSIEERLDKLEDWTVIADKKFDLIEKKFVEVDEHFDKLETYLATRFAEVESKIDNFFEEIYNIRKLTELHTVKIGRLEVRYKNNDR
jgi:hypothetical protein